MNDSWNEVARRGALTAQFQSKKLAQSLGYAVSVNAGLIGIIFPDGMPAFALGFESPATAAAWCREMQPRHMGAHTAGHAHGEDADSLIALCRGGTVLH